MPGLDVTANWKSWDLNATDGLFYTDSNGMEIIRRQSDSYNERYHTTNTQRASSNYYPINSAIFIEDVAQGEQMIVMNDRSEGGSAFNDGNIELMVNRRGNTTDDLGNDESLNETQWVNGREVGIRVNSKFKLKFTKSREDAFHTIREHYLLTQNPLQIFSTATEPTLSGSDIERKLEIANVD